MTRGDLRGVIGFYVVASVLAWAFVAPFWFLEGGLGHPLALVALVGMMFSPLLAVAVTLRWIAPEPDVRGLLGLRLGRNRLVALVASTLGVAALALAAPFVGAALGRYELDLVGLSGFREVVAAAGQADALDAAGMPLGVLVVIQLVAALPVALVINSIPAFGEEVGWRGYLLPKLEGLGRWPALVLSGAMWGLWHAPAVALGHNYPTLPPLGAVAMMVGFCVVLGVLFGWLRLHTGSVWPATFAHATLNGYAGSAAILHRAGFVVDNSVVGITGWTGWLLPMLVIAVLAAVRVLPGDSPSRLSEGSR